MQPEKIFIKKVLKKIRFDRKKILNLKNCLFILKISESDKTTIDVVLLNQKKKTKVIHITRNTFYKRAKLFH